ncbi:ABC transporter ATP-binding protein [Photobacterium jeanii]|uniref:ABC transporter ATP-binding protein n=1 Tax=Photobacterium jeanii TaxID=858640 RepID=A0A178K8H1_9GAMM|nr:ATP-binding cassette domain-containing protein [Photobacterium jeanii]OAN12992.1 ABC transporter ATP-binding protein [Photobacterium jeanii]PST89140.1 sugar ABC transporter ATP-binding protein [Photobacterium jeanii]
MSNNVLEITGLNKWFGPVHALKNIEFSLRRGEVCALLGDNGAGKSTLIKLISGVETIEQGQVRINGHRLDIPNYGVKRARQLGIETVYQSGSLGEQQSVWRNLFLGRHLRNKLGFIDQKEERRQAAALLRKLDLRGVGADIDTPVNLLSGGERQGLAIGRAMLFDASVVILDEPTTALSLGEVDKVLRFIETLKEQQRACLLITHNMNDAFRVADRFVVMDRGHIVAEYHKSDMTQDALHKALLDAVGRGA